MKKILASVFSKQCLQAKRIMLILFCGLLSVGSINAQIEISGKVQSVNKEPLPGVAVVILNEMVGTVTDINGLFKLQVSEESSKIEFSFLGYTKQVVNVGSTTTFNITLTESAQELDEVVVVGYGTQKKANLTGAVAQIDSKAFEMRPVSSVASALQGVAAGVNINPTNGNPNSDISFNIRGENSINGGSPLVLVDGVEMSTKLLNPSDIESVSVLKDAASSAIYGVRAAFGVILITTKRGTASKDKLNISYSGNFSWDKPTIQPTLTSNSYDHALFLNEAMKNASLSPMYGDEQMAKIKAYYEDPAGTPAYYFNSEGRYVFNGYNNWTKMMINDYSPKQIHNVNISGGSGKTTFYASYSHTKQDGFTKVNPDIFKRNNVRLNLENSSYKWAKFGMRTTFSTSKMDEPHNYKDAMWHQMIFTSPLRPYKWTGDAAHPEYDKYVGMYFDDQNPVSLLDLGGRNVERDYEFTVTPTIDIKPMKNWNVHADFTYLRFNRDKTLHRKRADMINNSMKPSQGNTTNNSFEEINSYKNYYSFNAFTDYEITLNEKHYLKGMLGYNQELTNYKTNGSKVIDLISQNIPTTGLAMGARSTSATGYEWALRGAFARINYIYDNKYLFEVNGRYDGTSRFPKDNRFVFLPSFSLAWRLSEEKFMDFVKPIFSNIKIRMSYGKLGNQMMTTSAWGNVQRYYPYIGAMSDKLSSYYMFGGVNNTLYMDPAYLISSNMTWEKAATINGGLDLTLLNSRLNATFDIYRRTTTDMLYRQTYPELLGADAPYINGGELQTSGWELSLSWKDRIGDDFSYNIGFSLYDSQSKITKFKGAVTTVDSNYKGKKIGEIWGYISDGIIQTPEELAAIAKPTWNATWTVGDLKFRNRDGDGKISPGANRPDDHGDKVVIGNTTPRYNYGITLGVNYKGFFMSAFLQGIGKRDFYTGDQGFQPVGTQYFAVQKWHISDSWTPENRNAYFPLVRARQTKNFEKNSRFLQDASYLRMKNLTVGYNFPQKWLKYVKLERAQIYFSGENLFEKSNMKGPLDPEIASGTNAGGNIYPFRRAYSIGIDLTF